jgi:two-component system sensor histidine kinase UhpB
MKVDAALPSPFPALGGEQELVAYRVAQEALTNVVRHAEADRAWLSVAAADGVVLLGIEDDGRGIDDNAVPGAGLEGMRERALLVSGALKIGRSERGGTVVNLVLPLAGER